MQYYIVHMSVFLHIFNLELVKSMNVGHKDIGGNCIVTVSGMQKAVEDEENTEVAGSTETEKISRG